MSNSFKTAACTALRSFAVLVLGVSAFAVSCVREGADSPDRPVRAGEIRIEYSVDGVENATRSVTATAAEGLLKDVHVIFFNNDGTFIACQKADVTNGSSFFSFPVPEGVTEGVEYKTLIVGNALSWLPSGSTTLAEYLNTMSSKGYNYIRDALVAVGIKRIDISQGLPMWGEIRSDSGTSGGFIFTREPGGTFRLSGHIAFSRSVCRIDLKNNVATKLEITRVKLCNYRVGGYYFHQDVAYGSVVSGIGDTDGWVSVNAPNSGTQSLTAAIYTFPNMVPTVTQDDNVTTFLMIAGKYEGDNKETYYRFNMANNGSSQILRRNHCYTGTINSVSGPGSSTEDDVKGDTIGMLDYQVSDWQDGDAIMVEDGKGNYLRLSATEVFFSSVSGITELVNVQTNSGLTWTASWDSDATDYVDKSKFEFLKSSESVLQVSTNSNNVGSKLYKARLIISATGGTVQGNLKAKLDLIQFSSSQEMRILTVDGKTGTVQSTIPPSGGSVWLPVRTGSRSATWRVEGGNADICQWTSSGIDGGVLRVDFGPNVTTSPRVSTLKVIRVLDGGTDDTDVAAVQVELSQNAYDNAVITIDPIVPPGGFVLKGIEDNPLVYTSSVLGNNPPAGTHFYSDMQIFTVNINGDSYTYDVVSSFDSADAAVYKDVDALLRTSPYLFNKIADCHSGESFAFYSWRMGPGDPAIRGDIEIRVKNNTDIIQTVKIPITIVTDYKEEDTTIKRKDGKTILVPDRNLGAPYRVINGTFVPAKYFSSRTNTMITGREGAYGKYVEWAGFLFNKAALSSPNSHETLILNHWVVPNADDACIYSKWYKSSDALCWRLPKREDCEAIIDNLTISKGRVFVFDKNKKNGCYFPLVTADQTGALGQSNGASFPYTNYFADDAGLFLSTETSGSSASAYRSGTSSMANYYPCRLVREIPSE